MGATASAILDRLSRPEVVRQQVLVYLFLGRVHNSVKLSYEEYLAKEDLGELRSGNSQEPLNQLADSEDEESCESREMKAAKVNRCDQGADSEQRQELEKRLRRRRRRQHKHAEQKDKAIISRESQVEDIETNSRDRRLGDKQLDVKCDWDWQAFPEIWRPFVLYERVSTCWMIYASVRTLLLDRFGRLLNPLSSWLFGAPSNCLLMGRLAVPSALGELLSVILAAFHLVWRFINAHSKHNRLLTMIVFLMISERDLERFYALMGDTRNVVELSADYITTRAKTETETTKTRTSDKDDATPSIRRRGENSSSLRRRPAKRKLSRASPLLPPPSLSKTERLLRQVLCYKVEIRNSRGQRRHYYKLRPNRTREAHRQLTKHFAFVTFVGLAIFALEFLIVCSLVLLAIASDYRYVHVYPGCYPLLDERFAQGKVTLWPFSVTFKNHHLISGIFFDFAENLFFWGDSGLAITFVSMLTYLLNYDLLMYWSHLNAKLKSLLKRTVLLQLYSTYDHVRRQLVQRPSYIRTSAGPGDPSSWMSDAPLRLPILDRAIPPVAPIGPLSARRGAVQSLRELERDVHQFQFEVYDFFQQVRRADLLVGDTISGAIFFWLITCAFVTYNLLLDKVSSLFAIVFLTINFFVMAMMSYHLFELRRRCLGLHRMLCSLMARDQTQRKGTFISLLDFYLTNQDATTYHIARSYAYKPTTFVTIIGWTLSCILIVYSLILIPLRAKNVQNGYLSGG